MNSLLDFSRIESGRVQARYVPTDLAAYTADLASLFRSAIERAGLELVVDCEPLPEPRLRRPRDVGEGRPEPALERVQAHVRGADRRHAALDAATARSSSVSDTGIGIAPDELPRLFERFHRVRDARSRTHEGTGHRARARPGARRGCTAAQVRIESELGAGSTFVAGVRAGRAHLPAEQVGDASEAAVASVGRGRPCRRGRRAGCGSDDLRRRGDADAAARVRGRASCSPTTTRTCAGTSCRLLQGRFEVVAVPDGEAALQSAVADPPDLVLTDVMMPRLDGFGLLAALRADERTAAIPVIMLSARAGEEAAVEGLDAGADDYLVKPFSARELIARVSATLSLARLRQESAQRLEEVNRELEAAAAAKSQFVAGVSHEIRTPLNAIIGMTSLLLRSPLNDTQSEYAHVLRSSGEHLLNLIGDVLDFSKIEAGAIQLERAPFDVRRCVQDALDIVAVDARAKQLPLISHVAPDVPDWVVGDSGRLSQILINLLANAIKFTEAGQVTLTLEAGAASPYQCELRFAIADTGIGVSERRPGAALRGLRPGPTARRREGTGLGLAISAQLAEALGGAIGVESTLGAGSTFSLTIPAGLVDPPARPPRRPWHPRPRRTPRCASSSSTTTAPTSASPRCCSASSATPPTPRATASRRSRRSSGRPTTSSSWTCRCPSSAASRRRGSSAAATRTTAAR